MMIYNLLSVNVDINGDFLPAFDGHQQTSCIIRFNLQAADRGVPDSASILMNDSCTRELDVPCGNKWLLQRKKLADKTRE